MIQEYLPDVLQKINMLSLMIKPKILYGGNLTRQKYLITNPFPMRYGTIAKIYLLNSYPEKNFLWLIVSAEQIKIHGLVSDLFLRLHGRLIS